MDSKGEIAAIPPKVEFRTKKSFLLFSVLKEN